MVRKIAEILFFIGPIIGGFVWLFYNTINFYTMLSYNFLIISFVSGWLITLIVDILIFLVIIASGVELK